MRALIAGVCALALCGCSEADGRRSTTSRAELALQLHATSPQGEPVVGAQVWAGTRALGATDGEGELDSTLAGALGERITLAFRCPPTHHTSTATRTLSFQAGQRSRPVALTIECQPVEHLHALVVRARGTRREELPIQVDGLTLGHTNADGIAHLLFRTRPHASVRVSLDTRGDPSLRPANPVQSFRIENADRVLLFEQAFERARSRPATASTRSPYRIH